MRTTCAFLGVAMLLVVASSSEAQKVPRVSCGADVRVNVTVLDTPTSASSDARVNDADYSALYPLGYLLRSDGNGPYLDGVNKIVSHFQVDNCSQDFTLNMNFSGRKLRAYDAAGAFISTVSFFNFDRVANVPLTTPANDFLVSAFCTTSNTNPATPPGPNGPDNYGGCDVDGTDTAFVRRAVTMQLDFRDDQRLLLQRSPWDSFTRNICPGTSADASYRPCLTSYVRVYHPDADTWILSPEPRNELLNTDSTVPMAARLLYGTKGITSIGEQPLPFRLLVRKATAAP